MTLADVISMVSTFLLPGLSLRSCFEDCDEGPSAPFNPTCSAFSLLDFDLESQGQTTEKGWEDTFGKT